MKSLSVTPKGKPWDLVVIGAGPVGLSAARTASTYGLKVLVLESGDKPGPVKRAETVRDGPILTTIWGSGFLKEIYISVCNQNVFHSPGDVQKAEVIMLNTPHSFHWDDMIEAMYRIAGEKDDKKGSVIFSFNTSVTKAHLAGNKSKAVKFIRTTKGKVYGHTFIDCSGHTTAIGRQLLPRYKSIINPILKGRYSGFDYDRYPEYHTFFIPAGMLFPNTPPLMAALFPSSNGEVETACQFFDEYGQQGKRKKKDPPVTGELLLKYWHELVKKAPGLSKMMEGTEKQYAFITGMPSRKIISEPMLYPGLVITGDAGGCIDTESSSGLLSGMQCAYFWAMAAVTMKDKEWTADSVDFFTLSFHRQTFYRAYLATQKKINLAKSIVWGLFITPEKINNNWNLIKDMYNMNTKSKALERTPEEYKVMGWKEQSSHINGILKGKLVLQFAEEKIISFLKLSQTVLDKLDWNLFVSELDHDRLFDVFQGAADLAELYSIFGPASRVRCALAKNSKFIITRDVTPSAIKAASIIERQGLLSILLHSRPLGKKAREILGSIIKISLEDNPPEVVGAMIDELGGKKRILKYIPDKIIRKETERFIA